MKKFIFYTLTFVSFQILIVYLALFNPSKGLSPFVSGYFIHFIAVSLSVILLYAALTHDFIKFSQPLLICLAYGILISISGEITQLFFSHRSFDYMDMTFGVAAAMISTFGLYVREDLGY